MEAVRVGAAASDRATMVARVTEDAKRYFGGEVEEDALARWAEEAVARLWGDGVRVTTFVPMLALREVAEQVRAAKAAQSAAGAPGPALDEGTDHALDGHRGSR